MSNNDDNARLNDDLTGAISALEEAVTAIRDSLNCGSLLAYAIMPVLKKMCDARNEIADIQAAMKIDNERKDVRS